MPYRKVVFGTGEYYHVFNRSVGSEKIFTRKDGLKRALNLVDFYRFPRQISYSDIRKLGTEQRQVRLKQIRASQPLVEIHCFAFMQDHFHFLLKQVSENGITLFTSNFQNSYAKYFNTLYHRHGTLFSNMFKGVYIESDEQALHLSRYIHLNPVTSYQIEIEALDTYEFTSFSTYMNNIERKFISKSLINSCFKTNQKYRQFVYDQVDYQRKLKQLRNQLID